MMLFRCCVALAAAFCAACAAESREAVPPRLAAMSPAIASTEPPSPQPSFAGGRGGPASASDRSAARASEGSGARASVSDSQGAPPPGPDAKVLAEAQTYLSTGLAAFQRGDYEAAEVALKTAITLHPFLAQAHLTLGKVWLVRGAANKDYALVDNARLMFEMARAIDPALAEAGLMLDLFRTRPAE